MAVRYGELLRTNRSFRWLWIADVVSFLGDWFNTIALYTIVEELSGSGRAVAGILVGKTLPAFLVMPLAGPLVDRMDRKRLLIVADLVRAVLAGGLILSHHFRSLPALYACQVVMVSMTGIFFPARAAAIPQLCADEEIGAANALSGGTWSVMLALGAAFGGWVTAALGTDISLGLDGLTFVVSAAFLLTLPRLPAPRGVHHDRSFVGGLRHLAAHGRILALASLKPMLALASGALLLIPVMAGGFFPGRSGPFWMGVLYSARGLGALVGSVVLIRVFGDSSRALRRCLLAMYPLAALAFGALVFVKSIEAAAVVYFVAAIGNGGIWVMSGTLLQREGDKRFLGRIFSAEFGTMTLVVSAMSWTSGVALDAGWLDVRGVAAASAALLLIPIVVWGTHLARERGRAREAERHGVIPPAPGIAPETFDTAPAPEEGDR